MGIENLGFRDLRYVIAVAECGSISRAADACAITQPALSERLKRIETTIGVELFERNNRAIRVTDAGEQFVIKARQLLDQAAEFDAFVSTARESLSGPLHLGIIATLGPYLMPHLLPPLRMQYPNLELVLQEGLTEYGGKRRGLHLVARARGGQETAADQTHEVRKPRWRTAVRTADRPRMEKVIRA